jgi:phosphoribosyl-AMP cyclohydrolase
MDPKSELDFEKGGGLVTAIAQDDASGEILMVAFMNEESFARTLETGEVHYWSRSRNRLWYKGEESGNTQRVKSLYIDCDGDVVLLRVEQKGGAACHTGRRSCFFRKLEDGEYRVVSEPVFDPAEVYSRAKGANEGTKKGAKKGLREVERR